MKLKQVNSSQLKWDPTGHPLWFNGLEQDLYLVIGENEVRHFEISFSEHLISGGASKALQYGHIIKDGGRSHELSRLVQYQKEVPKEIVDQSIKIIESCLKLEPELKRGLTRYLQGFSFGSNPLRFESTLKSYLPLERRKLSEPKFRPRHLKKLLPEHLGLKVMGVLIVIGIVAAYFSMENSKGQEFLNMDDRMNPAYIDRYVKKGGDLTVLDSQEKGIMHRTAQHISSLEDEQYEAFIHLLIEYKLDPNTFDINGKTPLYYMMRNYLTPPESLIHAHNTRAQYRAKMLKVIEQMLKLGLKPKIKKHPDDNSAWDLAKERLELRELVQSRSN